MGSLKNVLPDIVKDYLKRLLRYCRKFTSGRWAKKHAVAIDDFCEKLDQELWGEAKKFSLDLEREGRKKLVQSNVRQGGAGALPLIYFVVRKIRPNVAIETGVASGWSSSSILAALNANGKGALYSSDLPYPNIKDSDKAVGLVVDAKFKERWHLYLGNDTISLPAILSELDTVDFLHYDSDKSVNGREFAWRLIEPYLSQNAVVIFDDIQDNYHFRDLMEGLGCDYIIFEYAGKYLGMFCPGASFGTLFRINKSVD